MTVQPAASVATDLLPWFQIVGTVFTATAAVAAAVSARAALRTAGKADETSRRAVEALGRATKPVLAIELDDASAPHHGGAVVPRSRAEGPAPMRLFVENSSPNRGLLTAARLHRTDGFTATGTTPLPKVIGSTAVGYEANYRVVIPLGRMPRLLTEAGGGTVDSDVVITVEVEFTDVDRVVRWCQRSRWQERAEFLIEGPLYYSYVLLDESEPEIVGDRLR